MAKQIIWSIKAKDDKLKILNYWFNRNKSNIYPDKLNTLFDKAIDQLSKNKLPRRITNIPNVYVKIVRDYKIFFKETESIIYIITIWDTRQDPNRLKL